MQAKRTYKAPLKLNQNPNKNKSNHNQNKTKHPLVRLNVMRAYSHSKEGIF